MKFADLHLHSRYSDGSWTPAEVVARARRLGFAAIAITDHDTLDGIPQALDAAGRARPPGAPNQPGGPSGRPGGPSRPDIEVLPGVEITCRVDAMEVHMLGYLPGDAWQSPALRAVLEHSRRVREKRIGEIVGRLNQLGVPLTEQEVFACSEGGTIGRPHVALALERRGIVASNVEAFERFLKAGKPAYVERYRMTAAEAIGHITRAGGVAVLAHPGLNRVDDRIAEMAEQGMGGLEVWHSRHAPSQTEHYRKLAERLGLIATGGSDCHGEMRGRPLLGAIKVPYECVAALKSRAGGECGGSPPLSADAHNAPKAAASRSTPKTT
jgi:predicted metal-dependent phosphoesterase TrpH